MSDLPIEELLEKSDFSIYRLVRMAAKRALEISEGRKCLVENPSSDKATSMALEEIFQGKIEYKRKNGASPKK
ncbi:MAG: DNA-directed RNA polymerase subunit omega [Candidatus Omnitrophica bacterium]|nr:DNA-directed RNA polymerase subunit omega [Candidatus Omnitrophota bacterium]MCB9747104.1 DNA-directed RNA polymerase subunit omega [Candidatus Omnitrophota bacterium]